MSSKKVPSRTRRAYQFIESHRNEFSVQMMCRLLGVARAGYYAWLDHPVSDRAQEDARLLRLIRSSFTASHGIYGAPRVLQDLRERGEKCSKHRVARLMRENGIQALHGYRIRHIPVAKPHALIPNVLQRQFTVSRPNEAWVTDITYIRTWQGWLYFGRRRGPLLAQGRRLGRQADDSSRAGPRSRLEGRSCSAPKKDPDPLGSGNAVWKRRVATLLQGQPS